MRYFRRSAFLRLVVLPFTLLAFLPACHKWSEVRTTVDATTALPNPARLTLNNGDRITLEDATISGDSVVGIRERRSEISPIRRVAIALGDVAGVEERSVKIGESVGTGVGVAGVLFLGLAAITFGL